MQHIPLPSAVLDLAGATTPYDETLVGRLLNCAADAAHHYTGGRGFSADRTRVEPDLAEALVTSVARYLQNPELALAEGADPFSLRPGSFGDWSDAELVLLERYRHG